MRLKSGAVLRALMDQQGRSLADVGRYADRDKTFIWALTHETRTTCKPEVAQRIAELLDVPLTVLFDPKVSPVKGQTGSRAGKGKAA